VRQSAMGASNEPLAHDGRTAQQAMNGPLRRTMAITGEMAFDVCSETFRALAGDRVKPSRTGRKE
jgi:hypothetical protein